MDNIDDLLFEMYLGVIEDTIYNRTIQESIHDEDLKRNDNVKVMLEKVRYNENEPVECEICFDDIITGETTFNLDCYHKFHSDCLMEWMHYKKNCPVCRGDIN